ncbi:MAG: hypothetical protein ACE5IZ_08985 [Dehalococcoidia bacterium]
MAQRRQLIKLPEFEWQLPAGIHPTTRELLSLKQIWRDGLQYVSLQDLEAEQLVNLAVARIEQTPEDFDYAVLGDRTYSKEELKSEILNKTEVGQEYVRGLQAWLDRLFRKIAREEYS